VNPPSENLAAAMSRRQISLPQPQVELLEKYCHLLWQWNEKLNLTRHTDFDKFVDRDIVDSLAIARYLAKGETILDVGTGGGVPGIVLAIVREDLGVVLCESVGKKAKAVGEIVGGLGIDVAVIHGRAEDLLTGQSFDTLVVRAVGRMKKLLQWFDPHWNSIGRMLLLKGPAWVEERGEARHFGLMRKLALRKVTSYPMPGGDSESVLLQICRKNKVDRFSKEPVWDLPSGE
jgi:16S rRNA (guanine527-N7)-methyltransferase